MVVVWAAAVGDVGDELACAVEGPGVTGCREVPAETQLPGLALFVDEVPCDRIIPTVYLIDAYTTEYLAETASLVKGFDRRIITAEVDVRDYDALKGAVDSGVEQLGRLDIIVANVGISNGGNTLNKTTKTNWVTMIDIKLAGVWKTVKAGVPHILGGGRGGSIILASSVGGLKAYPHTGHYVAAKHGVIGLMRAFAVELGAGTYASTPCTPPTSTPRCS